MVVGPAGKDRIGRGADGGVFVFAGGDLTEMGQGDGEDFGWELEFGKIADNCDADGGGVRGIEIMDNVSVDRLILDGCVSDGIDGTDETFRGLVVATEETGDGCCYWWT